MKVNILRGKLVEAGITQRDLAEKLSLSVTSITRKMNGLNEFTLNEVVQICNVLNLDDADKLRIFFA